MTQGAARPVVNQEGEFVQAPQSSVVIEIPTDPKKDFGCTIKVYGPDGQADYELAFKLAAEFVAKRAALKAGTLASDGSVGAGSGPLSPFPV